MPKKKPVTDSSWGVVLTDAIPHSMDGCCQNCGWDCGYREMYPGAYWQIVGFEAPGILIIECAKCFEKFWFHTSEDLAEYLGKWCEAWPKK